jgi:archaellin
MDNVMVSVTTGDGSDYLKASDVENADNIHATDAVADEAYGFNKTLKVQTTYEDFVLGQGDLAELSITGLSVGYNELVTIKIIPAYGQMTLITFVTPEQYSSEYITLS